MTTVHVVDDESSVRKALGRLLRAAGYVVATYESVEQFLDQLPKKKEPGCILLDVLMPGVNGIMLQERMTEVGSVLPVIFMTGSVERIEGGTEGFLLKPVSREKLLDAIERALGPALPNSAFPVNGFGSQ